MKNLIIVSSIILSLFGCQQNKIKSNDSILKTYFESTSIPSAIIGSIDADGETTWHRFGPSIWEDSTKIVTEDNIFRIYSMTKAITSVAALQLVEKGLIGLDDPLNELMPEMVVIPILNEDGNLIHSDEIITLRQLLTHTSGFGQKYFSSKLDNFNDENWSHKTLPRIFQPGTSFAYGEGLFWAGKVVEKISKQDLENYFREHITGPLKMNATWFNLPKTLAEDIVTLGGRDSLGVIEAWGRIPKKPKTDYSGASGLFASPSDYLKFLRCMMNFGKYEGGQLLKRETVELMLKDNLPKGIRPQFDKFENGGIVSYSGDKYDVMKNDLMKNDSWGFGWFIELDENDIRPVNSVYWGGAANSYYTLDVKNKIAIVYFSNYFPANDKEAYDFYKLYENEVFKHISRK